VVIRVWRVAVPTGAGGLFGGSCSIRRGGVRGRTLLAAGSRAGADREQNPGALFDLLPGGNRLFEHLPGAFFFALPVLDDRSQPGLIEPFARRRLVEFLDVGDLHVGSKDGAVDFFGLGARPVGYAFE
jgi:hypothetical protein